MAQKLNIKIPATAISDVAFGNLTIKNVVPGTTSIENIILESFDVNIKPSTVRLEGVSVGVSLVFYIYWEIGICIDYVVGSKCWTWDHRDRIGTLPLPAIGVPDIDLSMDKIPFHLNQIALGQMNATIKPIENFRLGKGHAYKIMLHDAEIPPDWFTLEGMGVGGMKAQNINLSKMTSKWVDVGSIPGIQISIPNVELPEIKIQASAVGAESGAVSARAAIDQEYCAPSFYVDLGVGFFSATICVKPVVRVNITKMRMSNVLLDAKVNKTIIQNVTVPMNLSGLQVQKLKINNISVPMIRMDNIP